MRFIAVIAAVLFAVQAQASTLTFTFSFVNAANGGGTVTGVVRGLLDNATSAATSVEILSNSSGFGLGEYVAGQFDNIWRVKAGRLVTFQFFSEGIENALLPNNSLALQRYFYRNRYFVDAGLSDLPVFSYSQEEIDRPVTNLTFSPTLTPVPLPATLTLLAAGLLALGYGRRPVGLPPSAAGIQEADNL